VTGFCGDGRAVIQNVTPRANIGVLKAKGLFLGSWSNFAILSVLSPFLRHFKIGVRGETFSPTAIGQTCLDIKQRKEICQDAADVDDSDLDLEEWGVCVFTYCLLWIRRRLLGSLCVALYS